MIKDLQSAGSTPLNCDAHVCIIGGGTAGLFLGRLLRQQGIQVVLLEAGDSKARSPEELRLRCDQKGVTYRGAELGRSFGLGGTSVLWGGQLLPMTKADFGSRPEAGLDAWPISYSEVARYYALVREQLGLPDAAPGESEHKIAANEFVDLLDLDGHFDLRLSEWLPFKQRNFATALSEALQKDEGIVVWLNAAVSEMTRSGTDGRIDTVTAQSPNSRTLIVRPSVVVICAGALESTRLLLEFDESTGGSITREGSPLGRYFSDHLSVTCGRFICRDWSGYNLAVAPIFRQGVMRSPRLELTAATQKELRLPSAFAHFTFVTSGDTGFDVVRTVLRRRQGELQRLPLSPKTIGRVIPDVSAMAYWRWVHRRLWIPRQADLLLQIDIEQSPSRDSRVYLSGENGDRKRGLTIDWRISESDVRTIRKTTELIVAGWGSSRLQRFADLEVTLPSEGYSLANLYDVYHPSGCLRMGTSPANSVVNKDLSLWATSNCYVTTTAVFPTSGSANPGMTHLALTARLADRLAALSRD